jgi:hypothetical protein
MPYIKQDRRSEVQSGRDARVKGELTFVVFREALRYLEAHGVSYETISDAKSALQDAADEVHDRILRPYEDDKIEENGDVFS